MPSRLIARGVRPSPPAPDAAPVPWPPSGAIWETGGQMSVDERIERSRLLYEQALFESDAGASTRKKNQEIGANGSTGDYDDDLAGKIFYPFTFPITAGPGTLVVMLTLSARVSNKGLIETAEGHAGIVLAAVLLSASVYFCYAYAPRLIKAVSPSTVHGILRVIAFVLMCIGVQIAWNGISMLGPTLANHK